MKLNKAMLMIVLVGAFGQVWAGNSNNTDYARVLSATPVYEQVAHTVPQRECWTEQVRYESPDYQRRSATGALLGTVIGAAVGHNVAKSKKGQRVGRVAGAILGASIGSDISKKKPRSYKHVEYRDEQRCEVQHTTQYEQVLVGYDVAYKYSGKIYYARMDQHPGKRLPVAVKVQPLY